jgi:phage terminase large subunit-like protein
LRRAFKRPRTRAGRVIAFLERLNITSGAKAGHKLKLRPWQRRAITRIYATDAKGRRPVRTALLSLGRKSGKSTLTAALALCHLADCEAVPRGQVVAAAADRNQAGIIFAELKAFVLADAELSGRIVFREWNKSAQDTVTGSVFITASSDHRKAHGTSPTFFVADEVAQWRGRELLDALRTGQGAHAEPLGIIISTRSPDPDSPLEELIKYGAEVDAGIVQDSTFAAFVYSAPMDADPWAPETWLLANPDADAVRLADIAVQARQAMRLPSQESSFRAYILNQPVQADDRFIAPGDWDACAGTAEAVGPVYGGLDLASGAADLTAFVLYWPTTGRLTCWAFLPALKLDQKAAEDRAPYRQFAAAGHVIEIPGKAIDRTWLAEWIATKTEGLDVQGIASDRWGLADWQAVLDREGIRLPMVARGTGYKDASPDIGAFERAVLDGNIAHGGNALLRWAVSNAVIDTDPAGNRKLAKDRARGRIDPLAAAVQAVGLAGRAPAAASFEFTGMLLTA